MEPGEHLDKQGRTNLGLPPGARQRVRLVGSNTDNTVQAGPPAAQWENHLHFMVNLEGGNRRVFTGQRLTHLEVAALALDAINQRDMVFAESLPNVGIG